MNMNMKVQLFAAAASIALLRMCSADPHGGVALESDVRGGGGLRGIVGSFLESTNRARCRQKCDTRWDVTSLSKCQSYCDDVCGSNVRDAGDKCKRPCDYIDCGGGGGDDDDVDDKIKDERCFSSSECPSSQYCKFTNGDCSPFDTGRCTDMDKGCNRKLSPVCGCDQREYDNACIAENYGVTIDYTGRCDEAGRTALDFDGTCRRNSECDSGYYCKPLFGECSTDNRKGFCTRIPQDKNECRQFSNDQVCTCNGKTEKNECRAEFELQGVKRGGECSAPLPQCYNLGDSCEKDKDCRTGGFNPCQKCGNKVGTQYYKRCYSP